MFHRGRQATCRHARQRHEKVCGRVCRSVAAGWTPMTMLPPVLVNAVTDVMRYYSLVCCTQLQRDQCAAGTPAACVRHNSMGEGVDVDFVKCAWQFPSLCACLVFAVWQHGFARLLPIPGPAQLLDAALLQPLHASVLAVTAGRVDTGRPLWRHCTR